MVPWYFFIAIRAHHLALDLFVRAFVRQARSVEGRRHASASRSTSEFPELGFATLAVVVCVFAVGNVLRGIEIDSSAENMSVYELGDGDDDECGDDYDDDD